MLPVVSLVVIAAVGCCSSVCCVGLCLVSSCVCYKYGRLRGHRACSRRPDFRAPKPNEISNSAFVEFGICPEDGSVKTIYDGLTYPETHGDSESKHRRKVSDSVSVPTRVLDTETPDRDGQDIASNYTGSLSSVSSYILGGKSLAHDMMSSTPHVPGREHCTEGTKGNNRRVGATNSWSPDGTKINDGYITEKSISERKASEATAHDSPQSDGSLLLYSVGNLSCSQESVTLASVGIPTVQGVGTDDGYIRSLVEYSTDHRDREDDLSFNGTDAHSASSQAQKIGEVSHLSDGYINETGLPFERKPSEANAHDPSQLRKSFLFRSYSSLPSPVNETLEVLRGTTVQGMEEGDGYIRSLVEYSTDHRDREDDLSFNGTDAHSASSQAQKIGEVSHLSDGYVTETGLPFERKPSEANAHDPSQLRKSFLFRSYSSLPSPVNETLEVLRGTTVQGMEEGDGYIRSPVEYSADHRDREDDLSFNGTDAHSASSPAQKIDEVSHLSDGYITETGLSLQGIGHCSFQPKDSFSLSSGSSLCLSDVSKVSGNDHSVITQGKIGNDYISYT